MKKYALRYMESKGSFEYSGRVIEELRAKCEEWVGKVEGQLGDAGREGAEGLRGVLGRLILK